MDHHENQHCVSTMWYDTYHYYKNSCVGVKDDYDRVELYPRGKRYPSLAFEMPRQKHELQKVQDMMKEAYERGNSDNRKSIANLLKELIAI
jgi:hypothetical protein